jgi:hypothetical protein
MRTLVLLASLTLAGVATALPRPTLRDRETPSAADLLRAELAAKRAAGRLRLPKRPVAGWRRGGGGFGATARPAPPESPSIRIDVHPGRGRAR